MTGLFSRALRGEPTGVPPIWLMRQAGRYLPEYNATRARAGSFLKLAKTPALATEVTLQPLERKDLAEWHKSWFLPNNATLVVAGDVTLDKLKPELERGPLRSILRRPRVMLGRERHAREQNDEQAGLSHYSLQKQNGRPGL